MLPNEVRLAVVLRQAQQAEINEQLQEQLLTRAVIDQAIGMVMGSRRCTASEAFAVLRQGGARTEHQTL